MDRLAEDPKNFRELVEADLRRAARLIIKIQDEIDPQWRIATPTGDWWIATTLPNNDDHGRAEILRALGTFMVWKQAMGFTLASELTAPDCIFCCGITATERHACFARIRRRPQPWTKDNFDTVEWTDAASIDPLIVDLLPPVPRPLTPKDVGAMVKWFGRAGKFPAVNMMTGEVGA